MDERSGLKHGRASLPSMRPLLTPAARRLWRDQETLQLGRTPGRAVVLTGVDGAARGLLGLLDGTRDHDAVVLAARDGGCPPPRTERMLTLLDSAGLLEDAAADRSALRVLVRDERDRLTADLRSLELAGAADALRVVSRRLGARVVVEGAGRVGAAVAALLASSGIGAVDIIDEGLTRPEDCGAGGLRLTDIGRRRGEAARDLIATLAPSVRTAPLVLPDLVVLAPAAGLPHPDPPRLVPHLLAEVRDGTGIVGPLVQPGIGACLHCLDLARTDRDPDWPAIAAQLSMPAPGVAPCDAGLAAAVTAQAVLQTLSLVDGLEPPATIGGTLELTLPGWRWRRRSWQVHPACECAWRDTG